MISRIEVSRELLERAVMPPGKESLAVSNANIIERGQAQAEIRELLAATAATASLTNEGETPVVERHPVGYEYYSRPLRSWRPLETEADKARAESMDCDVREIAQPELAALQSTIAQLKAENERVNTAWHDMKRELDVTKAENERLQAEADQNVGWEETFGPDYTGDADIPIAVKLPSRNEASKNLNLEQCGYVDGWNACLDEVRRMNP